MDLLEKLQALADIHVGGIQLGNILSALLALAICLAVSRGLSAAIRRMLGRAKKLDPTLRGFLQSAVRILLWVLTAIIVADALGLSTSSLVAVVSVVGLALSLSIQNVMANVFSGITLLVTKPFEAGDYVDISGKVGTVKQVGIFYTVLDTFENMRVSVPNADVTAAAVINYSAEPVRRLDMTFNASYDDDTDAVRSALLEAAGQDERVLAEPAPMAAIREFGSSAVSYALRVWCRQEDYWDVRFHLNELVRELFAQRGVKMTYEHVNVHIQNGP